MFWGLSLKPHRNFSYEPAIRLMVVFGDGGGGEIALLCLRVYGQVDEKGFSFTRKFKFLNV